MEKTKKQKDSKNRGSYIALNEDSISLVEERLNDLREKYPKLKLSRKDIVNWTIKKYLAELKPKDEQNIYSKFYDEVEALKEALIEAKRLKKEGKPVSIDELLKGNTPKERKPREPKRNKKPVLTPNVEVSPHENKSLISN